MTEAANVTPLGIRDLLQVTPPSTAVEWINMLVYGEPGVGKTYLAGTADDDERTSPVLFLDVEGGVTTIRHKPSIDVIRVRSRSSLEDAFNKLYHSIELNNGVESLYYKTVVIDSWTELASLDLHTIMEAAYKRAPDKVEKSVPSQREWGIAREHMRTLTRLFRDLPCNVIFTAHMATQQEEAQPTKHFPGFAGKLRTEIPGFVDVVGYLYSEIDREQIIRKLQFQPTRRVVAKDRTGALGTVMENPSIPKLWDAIHSQSQD